MSQAVVTQSNEVSLTGLLVPLADRTLLLPNVALASLLWVTMAWLMTKKSSAGMRCNVRRDG